MADDHVMEALKCCSCSVETAGLLKSLYCEHVYCVECLRKLPRKDRKLECCVCYSQSEVLAGASICSLPTPWVMGAIARFRQSSSSGSETENDSSGGVDLPICYSSSHFPVRQLLDRYCYSCHELFCSHCDDLIHYEHKQEFLTNEEQLRTIPLADVEAILSDVEGEAERVREAIDQFEIREEEITSQGERVKEEFNEIKRKIIKFLNCSEERIQKDVDSVVKRKTSVLKEQMQLAENTLDKLEECKNKLKLDDQPHHKMVPGSPEHSHAVCHVATIVNSVRNRSFPVLEFPDIKLSKKWKKTEKLTKTVMTWKPISYTFHPLSVEMIRQTTDSPHHIMHQGSKMEIAFPHPLLYGQLPLSRISCSVVPIKAKRSSVPVKIESTSVSLRFSVSFTPTNHGLHHLEVMVNDTVIPNSPFVFKVHRPPSTEENVVRTISDVEAPYGIDVTCCGDVVVTELNGKCISVFNGGGTKLESFKLNNESESMPFGIACYGIDTVYVTDKGRHEISRYTLQGECIATVGGFGIGCREFNSPTGIAVDHQRRKVYVADTKNHRVQVLSLDLSFERMFGGLGQTCGLFNEPCDIAVDSNGYIYVADSLNYRVQKLTSLGEALVCIVGGKPAPYKFQLPIGVAIDQRNFVYISDMKSRCVWIFNSCGDFICKFNMSSKSCDGTSILYRLNENGPAQLAFDHEESLLYVCNPINNRVCVLAI